MTQWDRVKIEALLKCKRHCCFCQRYVGIQIEVHHIIQRADGGKDDFDNAIPLCFGCHSEIGSYNPNHPKGNKYKPEELKAIRDNFYSIAENLVYRPNILSEADNNLLTELKNDYTDILEYCIRTDFTSDFISIDLSDMIFNREYYKWSQKKYKFSIVPLESLKDDLLSALGELTYYLSSEYFRLHEERGMLICKNQSLEEGYKLREELRPNTLRIRKEIKRILDSMYSY